MDKKDWLAKNFEETRGHLKAVAYRMLGSTGEAEDAVQETWIRLNRSESEKIENLGGWLTTVVARVCLDMLRSRKSRGEAPLTEQTKISSENPHQLETDFIMADSVGPALLMVLDLLTPAERIAFVLHDLFDMCFEEIAPIIDRSEEATRQLASRARRRVRGGPSSQDNMERRHEMVSAFIVASREGNFEALIRLLHPEATLRADATAIKVAEANKAKGAPQFQREIKGAKDIANTLKGKAAAAQMALIDGRAGMTWAPGGKPVVAFCFTVEDDQVTDIEIVMDPHRLKDLEIKIISESGPVGGTIK